MNIEISAITKAEKDTDTGIKFSDGYITVHSGIHHIAFEVGADEDQFICDIFVLAKDKATDGLVGYAPLKVRENGELRIDWVEVHPKYQKSGIGSLIMGYIEKHSKDFKTLSAKVFNNNAAGKGLVTAEGFRSAKKHDERSMVFEKPVDTKKATLTFQNPIKTKSTTETSSSPQ
jgi:ribosomal protein S18 acetylase RimI-like enzyme